MVVGEDVGKDGKMTVNQHEEVSQTKEVITVILNKEEGGWNITKKLIIEERKQGKKERKVEKREDKE